jgi:transcriptional regulator with XRE-family HTH domain
MSRLENGKQGYRSGTLERVAKALEVKPLYFYIEDSPKGVAEGAPVYGLAAGGELVEALRSAEFVRVVEKVAEAFHSRRPAFDAINLAVRAIVGEEK